MVRNEEIFLEASLSSVCDWVDEVIVADSGSTDRTPDIAKSFRTRSPRFSFHNVEWRDHYGNLRNEIAAKAQNQWVLFVDGDEVLDLEAPSLVEKAIADTNVASYSLIQRNYTWNHLIVGATLHSGPLPPGFEGTPQQPLYFFENWMERLYQPQRLQYEGRIHESLLVGARRKNLTAKNLPLVLHHYGRLKSNQDQKVSYYEQLTEQKWKEEPDNPAAWVELLTVRLEAGRLAEALTTAKDAVEKFSKEPAVLRFAGDCALRANQHQLAENWLAQALEIQNDDQNLRALLATAILFQGQLDRAEKIARDVLSREPHQFQSHLCLLIIQFERKNFYDASRHLSELLKQKPNDDFLRSAEKKIAAALQSR